MKPFKMGDFQGPTVYLPEGNCCTHKTGIECWFQSKYGDPCRIVHGDVEAMRSDETTNCGVNCSGKNVHPLIFRKNVMFKKTSSRCSSRFYGHLSFLGIAT